MVWREWMGMGWSRMMGVEGVGVLVSMVSFLFWGMVWHGMGWDVRVQGCWS